MKLKSFILGLSLLCAAGAGMMSCSHQETEVEISEEPVRVPNTDGSLKSYFSINGKRVTYTIEKTTLSVGDVLRVKIERDEDSNIGVALFFDGEKVADVAEFPYVYEREMTESGTHRLGFQGGIVSGGSLVSTSVAIQFTEYITVK